MTYHSYREVELCTIIFRKLGQRLALKNKVEEELRGRIDQLEKRQTQDDAVINVINRLDYLNFGFGSAMNFDY